MTELGTGGRRWTKALLGMAAAAFLAAGAPVGTGSVAKADQFAPVGGGWRYYENDRFGTRLEVPPGYVAAEAPANRDGRRFTSEDATLEVYAWHNIGGESATALKRRLVGSDGYTDVTYSPSGRNWLVLSGYRDNNIFYEKYFFRGQNIHGFGMEYPAIRKTRYAPFIERIENSFRAGQ